MVHAETGALRAGQQPEGPGVGTNQQTAADQVTGLYRAHGMDLVRIAAVMLGSRAGAEDAEQRGAGVPEPEEGDARGDAGC
jgi:hypothetical protein